MALKKSELYSSLWESCNELRGGMDASQYKDYVLVLLFVKYKSSSLTTLRKPTPRSLLPNISPRLIALCMKPNTPVTTSQGYGSIPSTKVMLVQ